MTNHKLKIGVSNLDARPISYGEWLEYLYSTGQEPNSRRFQITGVFQKSLIIRKWYSTETETPTINDPALGISYDEAKKFADWRGGTLPSPDLLLKAMGFQSNEGVNAWADSRQETWPSLPGMPPWTDRWQGTLNPADDFVFSERWEWIIHPPFTGYSLEEFQAPVLAVVKAEDYAVYDRWDRAPAIGGGAIAFRCAYP